jgi:hypothetical protein
LPRYTTLSDILAADGVKQQIGADVRALVEQQLDAKSGISATVLKAAYKVVTAFAPGYYEAKIERIVPDVLARLQPFWSDFQSSGGGQFGDYLNGRAPEVAEAVLGVTDALAQRSNRAVVVKAYNTVRGGAVEHIQAALPSVGALVEKYAA